jgi:LacI family transcriptional regulator
MRVSLQEIAKQLNISRITVSKVLNNKPGVSLDTKKRVINKLVENGYKIIDSDLIDLVFPISKPEKQCITVVATAPEFSDYWLKIINNITNTLSELKYDCIYCFLSNKDDTQSSLPKIINSKGVSGIIVINVYDEKVSRTLLDFGIPIVFLDICPKFFHDGINGDLILIDGSKSIFEITDRIIKQGRKEIGFIGDITYSKTIFDRWQGYKNAMEDHGININASYCYTHSPGHYYYMEDIESQISKTEVLPQAFICANDSIAFMLIDILKKKNYRIPEDIAVSGFDNIKGTDGDSMLTTVSINIDILGQRLVKQILMRMQLPELPYEIIYIEPRTIYRQSTSFCSNSSKDWESASANEVPPQRYIK